jgi:hypothetical protein
VAAHLRRMWSPGISINAGCSWECTPKWHGPRIGHGAPLTIPLFSPRRPLGSYVPINRPHPVRFAGRQIEPTIASPPCLVSPPSPQAALGAVGRVGSAPPFPPPRLHSVSLVPICAAPRGEAKVSAVRRPWPASAEEIILLVPPSPTAGFRVHSRIGCGCRPTLTDEIAPSRAGEAYIATPELTGRFPEGLRSSRMAESGGF